MTQYSIVKCEIKHVDELMPDLRESDRIEISRATGMDVAEVLKASVELSVEAIAGYADDKLVLIAGVTSTSFVSGVGSPWLVGSNELPKHAMKMCRENKRYVERWMTLFSELRNYVDVDNKVSQRWLKWLGFELSEAIPYGPQKHLFHPFKRVR